MMIFTVEKKIFHHFKEAAKYQKEVKEKTGVAPVMEGEDTEAFWDFANIGYSE